MCFSHRNEDAAEIGLFAFLRSIGRVKLADGGRMALIADRGRADIGFWPSKRVTESFSEIDSLLLIDAIHPRLGLGWESAEDCKIRTE